MNLEIYLLKNAKVEVNYLLDNLDFESILNSLTGLEKLNSLSKNESLHLIENILSIIENPNIIRIDSNITNQCYKILRNLCAKGNEYQNKIVESSLFYENTEKLLLQYEQDNNINCIKMIFQCMANLCVQNNEVQLLTWNKLHIVLIRNLIFDSPVVNISAMILYNIFINSNNKFVVDYDESVFKSLIKIINDQGNRESQLEFVNLFLEYFIIKYQNSIKIYKSLSEVEKLLTITYITEIVKLDDRERRINTNLIKELLVEFKTKSDCILKTVTSYVEQIEPQQIIALLELVANISNQGCYSWILRYDGSLFLNIGCLLISIQKLGKASDNIFSPLQKLEYMAVNSTTGGSIEKDLSYEFKTMLVRCIANLSFKNKKNQKLAREMDIILAVLECTNIDARNPLIKEWSILAIRNLCEDNIENQTLIKSLTKVGDAVNPCLIDQRDENGSIRIHSGDN